MKINERLKNAIRALKGKPQTSIIFGVEVKNCSKCDYKKQAQKANNKKTSVKHYEHDGCQDCKYFDEDDDCFECANCKGTAVGAEKDNRTDNYTPLEAEE